MHPRDLIGKNIGAKAFKVLSLYDAATPPFKLVRKITTRGGILSNVIDVIARPSTKGNELMIGLQDEAGTSWVLYQPDLFYIGGKSDTDPAIQWVNIPESEISTAAEANSFTSQLLRPFKYVGIILAAGFVLLALTRKK